MTRVARARRSGPAAAVQEAEKRAAAERAARLVRPGMLVGLGSGTPAGFVLGLLAARLGRGELPEVAGVPTSTTVEAEARRLGTRHALRVEVVEFGWRPEAAYLESPGAEVSLRRAGVAGVGLFCGLTSDLVIATPAGVEHRRSHDKEQR